MFSGRYPENSLESLNMPINIRNADENDLLAVSELYAEWGQTGNYGLNDQLLVAEFGGVIRGAVRIGFEERALVIRSLYVQRGFRDQGIGAALLEGVKEELGVAEAYCLAYEHQKNFFARIGFIPVDRSHTPEFLLSRRESFIGQQQNIVILRRSLGFEVKAVTASDLDSVMALIRELGLPETRALTNNDARMSYNKILASGGEVLAVFRDGEMLGTCTLNVCANLSWSGRPYAVIENMIVTECERKQGIGSCLLLFARRLARQKNCYKISVMSPKQPADSIAFIEAVGL